MLKKKKKTGQFLATQSHLSVYEMGIWKKPGNQSPEKTLNSQDVEFLLSG